MAAREVSLSINYTPIKIVPFVQQFFEAVIVGIVDSLKEHGKEGDINLGIDNDIVDITIGGDAIELNDFVNTFTRNTVIGMASSLKGVGQIERLEIKIS